MEELTITIASRAGEARALIDQALRFFSAKKKEGYARTVDDYFFRLALDETVTNAVVHGNRKDPGRQVTVRIRLFESGLKLCVADEGAGFDLKTIPDPLSAERRWRRGGRGIHLLKSLGAVEWDRESRCITVEMGGTI